MKLVGQSKPVKLIVDMAGHYGGACTELDEELDDFHAANVLANQTAT